MNEKPAVVQVDTLGPNFQDTNTTRLVLSATIIVLVVLNPGDLVGDVVHWSHFVVVAVATVVAADGF